MKCSEGDDYSGRTSRIRLGEVKEELRSSAERRWRMSFARRLTARCYCSQQGDTTSQQGVSVPQQNTSAEDEPFAFEMVPSAPLSASTLRPSSAQPTLLNSLSSIMETLEGLADVVAEIEARMLCRFDSLEAKIAALHYVATESTPLPV